jgi:CHAT domain-containing protein
LGNGEEILGFGDQIQRTGVRGAIASLWSVDDGGTQVLISAFYAADGGKFIETLSIPSA